jgi:heme exporter protein D
MKGLSEFFSMGGSGFSVWGSYGVTALFMIIEIMLVIRNKRTVTQRVARMVRMSEQVEK